MEVSLKTEQRRSHTTVSSFRPWMRRAEAYWGTCRRKFYVEVLVKPRRPPSLPLFCVVFPDHSSFSVLRETSVAFPRYHFKKLKCYSYFNLFCPFFKAKRLKPHPCQSDGSRRRLSPVFSSLPCVLEAEKNLDSSSPFRYTPHYIFPATLAILHLKESSFLLRRLLTVAGFRPCPFLLGSRRLEGLNPVLRKMGLLLCAEVSLDSRAVLETTTTK
jgi:hypothetical protein